MTDRELMQHMNSFAAGMRLLAQALVQQRNEFVRAVNAAAKHAAK